MKVVVKANIIDRSAVLRVGTVLDLKDDEAQDLINRNLVELVEETKTIEVTTSKVKQKKAKK